MKTRLTLCAAAVILGASVGCDQTSTSKPEPAPPPPSDQVPNAPAPDNTVKEGTGGAGGGAR